MHVFTIWNNESKSAIVNRSSSLHISISILHVDNMLRHRSASVILALSSTLICRWRRKWRMHIVVHTTISVELLAYESLTISVCKCLVRALVTSRIEYGSAMLFSVTISRSCFYANSTRYRRSISAVLRHLHWLPIKERIQHKSLVFCRHCTL